MLLLEAIEEAKGKKIRRKGAYPGEYDWLSSQDTHWNNDSIKASDWEIQTDHQAMNSKIVYIGDMVFDIRQWVGRDQKIKIWQIICVILIFLNFILSIINLISK